MCRQNSWNLSQRGIKLFDLKLTVKKFSDSKDKNAFEVDLLGDAQSKLFETVDILRIKLLNNLFVNIGKVSFYLFPPKKVYKRNIKLSKGKI